MPEALPVLFRCSSGALPVLYPYFHFTNLHPIGLDRRLRPALGNIDQSAQLEISYN